MRRMPRVQWYRVGQPPTFLWKLRWNIVRLLPWRRINPKFGINIHIMQKHPEHQDSKEVIG